MKTKTSQRKNEISKLVERGFAIHQKIGVLSEEFKKIKERLKNEAAIRSTEHLPLLEKDSEGTQWIALGARCECHIIFPEAKIKSDFDSSEANFLTIRSLAGDHFKSLFRKVTLFRPKERKTFRDQAKKVLTPNAAGQFLELCSTPSESKAVWKARPATNSAAR